MMIMKGLAITTEVIFLAITVTLVFLVYSMATPVIKSMQDASVFEQTKSMMLDLDEKIQEVASEGKGSKRTIYINLGGGELLLDSDTDSIKWTMETSSMIVSPRSYQRMGNLMVGANLDTSAYTNSTQGAHILENQHLVVYLKNIGNSSSPEAYNTSELLMKVYNKDLDAWMDLERLEISIDGSPDSMYGTGYTELADEGYNLPRGMVNAYINTSYVYLNNYSITFTLESGADFITIEAEEF